MVGEVAYGVFVVLGGVCFDGFGREFAELRFALVLWKDDFYWWWCGYAF